MTHTPTHPHTHTHTPTPKSHHSNASIVFPKNQNRIGWLFKFLGLVGFAAVLSPAFLRVAWSYYTDKRVTRDIRYGPNPRNRLDLFLPTGCLFHGNHVVDSENIQVPSSSKNKNRPVVIFVTGGMWIIG